MKILKCLSIVHFSLVAICTAALIWGKQIIPELVIFSILVNLILGIIYLAILASIDENS